MTPALDDCPFCRAPATWLSKQPGGRDGAFETPLRALGCSNPKCPIKPHTEWENHDHFDGKNWVRDEPAGLDHIAAWNRRDLAVDTTAAEEVREYSRDFDLLLRNAISAVTALDDYTNVNETEFTGWGDGDVPPMAEFWRVKSGQALKALRELPRKSEATTAIDTRKLTKADAANWHMREGAHYNGGDEFFAYLYRCVEQPRISRYDRYERKDRSVTSTWRTDGTDMPSMDDAIEALNTPPVFDVAEIAYLWTVPHEFTDIREGIDWEINERVVNKGAVEWERGKARITIGGKRALEENGGVTKP